MSKKQTLGDRLANAIAWLVASAILYGVPVYFTLKCLAVGLIGA